MKKILLAGAAVLTLGIGAYSVYADSPEINSTEYNDEYEYVEEYGPQNGRHNREYYDEEGNESDRFEGSQDEYAPHHEERIQNALSDGRITEDEATERRREVDERNRDVEQYGNSRKGHQGGRRHHNGRRSNRRNGFGHCR